MKSTTRNSLVVLTAALWPLLVWPAERPEQAALEAASQSARIAGASLSKVQRWLHDVAVPKIDPETGLYKADDRWNYRDTAADCYPFFTWAAYVVDRDVFNGAARAILHREQALCNTVDRIPHPWDFETGAVVKEFTHDEMVFQASEYVKDGLIAMVEVTGPDEWFDRMRAIEDDLWARADVETPFGKIVSDNIEINGEQIQALARLYTMTGDEKYLDWAERLADYYFADPAFLPASLRDHGCEIIGGLGLLLGVESTHRPEKAREYGRHLERVFKTILAEGCNEDGMMYNRMKRTDEWHSRLSDGWGYNYVGFLDYDMATGTNTFRPGIERTLSMLSKPLYKDYSWERDNIDGWADSVEGGLYLLNRLPVAEGLHWANQETAAHIAMTGDPDHIWGTMKLESNGVRTTLIHALMHTQGIIARPWQQGLELGAAAVPGGITIVVRSESAYEGVLEFDIPRHRLFMGFRKDWPRMNTLPEWFTVEPASSYNVVDSNRDGARTFTGQQLRHGLSVSIAAGETHQSTVTAR